MKAVFTRFFSVLTANTPPYKKRYSSRKFLSLFLILFLAVGNAWGAEVIFKSSNKNDDGSAFAALSNGDTQLVGNGLAKMIATDKVALGTSTNKYGYRCDGGRLYIVFKFDGETDLTIKHNANSTGDRYMSLYSFSSTKALKDIASTDWGEKEQVPFTSLESPEGWEGGAASTVTTADYKKWNYSKKGCLNVVWENLPAGYYVLYGTGSEAYIYGFEANVAPSTPATEYSVTYDLNGGTGTEPTQGKVAENGTFTVASAEGVTPPAGKEFAGWSDGTNIYNAGDTYTMGAAAVIFTAQWQAETPKYDVTYNLNGGTGTEPTQGKVAEGTTITLAEAPIWEGYRFDGWLVKDENGNAVTITDGKFTMPAAKVAITAQWVKVWTVTFNTNGGSAIAPVVVDNNGTLTEPTAPKKDCYAFGEWQKDGVPFDFTTAMITSDITLTATWTPKYATSLDFAAITTAGTTGDNPIGTFLASGNMVASNLGGSEWETSTGKSGYVGYKLKNNGATITFLAQADKRVTITFGSIAADVTLKKGDETVTISAKSGDDAETVYNLDVTTDMVVSITTSSGSTVTLKSITIGDIPTISDDATLKDLKVNGTTIAGFNSATDSYYIEMPYGTQKADLPLVTATAKHEKAKVDIQNAKDRPDDTRATIKVTAENGETIKHYYVYFTNVAKEGVNLVKATIGDKSITLVTNESYIKSAIVQNSGVNGRDDGVSAGSKFQKNSYIKIEMPAGQHFKAKDIVDLEVTAIGGTYKLLVYSENSTAAEKLVIDEATAPVLVIGHNKVQLNKDAQALYLVRDGDNNWNPHVKSIIIQRYMDPFIESFVIGDAVGTITNKTIAIEVPAGTDVTALEPTIVAWANGGAKVTPTGAQDFTSPVTYKVSSAYAEDVPTEYTVTVTKAAAIKEVQIIGANTLKEDESITLTAKVIDTNDAEASNQGVTWTSNDETTAIVDANGVVTGVTAGTVTITATSVEDNTKSASVTITVAVNPCRTWNAPAESFSGDVTKGKLSIKNSGCSIDDINPFSGASKVYAYKIDGSSDYVELSFIDKSQFETLTLGVSSGSNGSTPTFAVVASKSAVFDEKTIVEIFTYNANAKDAEQSLVDVSIPEGTRNVRIYRKYNDIGSGSSVSVYYVNACKKDFVPLTSISLADANLAVGRTLAQKVVVNPTNADIQTTTWSIESATATGVTIDAATGVLTAAADATEGTVSVKVQVTDILGNSQEATATITIITEYTQANVTGSRTWDWAAESMGEIATESGSVEYLMANVSSQVPNTEAFRSDMLYITANYANRGASDKFFQGTKIRFNTTIDGLVRVYYRSTGSGKNVEITINGISAGSGDAFQWSNYIEVPAGEVTIVGTGIGENATGLTRIQKIEFLAPDYTRDNLNPTNIATICLPNGGIMTGATLYKMAGKNEYNKLCFDEVQDNIMVAGNPYLFVPENGNTKINVYYTDKLNATAGSDNGLYGTYVRLSTVDDGQNSLLWGKYIISNNKYIYVDANNCNLAANRAYIVLNEVQPLQEQNPAPGLRRIVLGTNESQVATGVDQVQGDNVPTKMIINGQLFILRGEKMYDAQGKLVK